MAGNSLIDRIDLLGLRIVISDDLGITRDDIRRAFALADACGIKIHGKTGAEAFDYLDKHEREVRIKLNISEEKPGVHSGYYDPTVLGGVFMPGDTKPGSCLTSLRAMDGKSFYFEGGIVHELIHAFEHLEAKDRGDSYVGDESEAARVGRALQSCMERHRACLCPDRWKNPPCCAKSLRRIGDY